MATVIDSLFVELGLDPRKFTEGVRDALSSMRGASNEVASLGSKIEEHGKKISDIFGVMKGGALGILGGLIGGAAAGYVDKIAGMDAATSRLSKSLGMNIEKLSTWQGMVRQVGGDPASASSTMAGLTDALTNVRMGNGFFSGMFATLMNRSGGWQGKNADQILNQVSAFLHGEVMAGRMSPEVARVYAQSVPGMNEDMMNLILKGPQALAEFAEAVRKQGVETKAAGDIAEDFQKKLGLLETAMMNLGRFSVPVVTALINAIMSPIESFWKMLSIGKGTPTDVVKEWFSGGNKSIKDLIDGLKGSTLGDGSGATTATPGGALLIKPGAGTASPAVQNLLGLLGGVSGIKEVTAMDDAYHKGLHSAHNQGRAMDLTVTDPSKSGAMASRIRAVLADNGINANVIDEYMNPSAHATGGHIHIGLPAGGNSSTVSVNQTINMNGGDADDVAKNSVAAMKKHLSIAAQANSGN